MLWLALHFPLLPLEALNCCAPEVDSPAAAVAQGRVVAASRAAAAAGVAAGMRLSSALGLAPGLLVCERQTGREEAALHALACSCGQFTPQLSLAPPATLLLEIGGCLRLFGGLAPLHAAVRAACAAQGFSVRTAAAPTALGATWLAWSGDGILCPDPAALQTALAKLPCILPEWGETARSRLRAFGMRTLADLQSLPAAELGRRIGAAPLLELARARGGIPDPRPPFVFPEKFRQGLELPAKVKAAPMLLFAGQRLLAALGGWLAARGAGIAACRLCLELEGDATLEVPLRPAAATRDPERLLRLLRERLERLDLPAPALALALAADDIVALPGASRPLFAGEGGAGEGALESLERLRARLGEGQVFTLESRPDYRPECAGVQAQAAGPAQEAAPPPGRRPLWLLPAPRPLPEFAGRLTLLAGPERIESGWWDEGEAAGDVRRDYFVAANAEGQCLWVFRNAEGWFLHGLFA